MNEYPEHDKLKEVSQLSNEIGTFLDWMQHDHNVSFCTYIEGYEDDFGDWLPSGFYPARKRIEEWLALYFEIDLEKIADEKDAMLEEIRRNN